MGKISLLDLSDTREAEGEGQRHRRKLSRRGPLKQSPIALYIFLHTRLFLQERRLSVHRNLSEGAMAVFGTHRGND